MDKTQIYVYEIMSQNVMFLRILIFECLRLKNKNIIYFEMIFRLFMQKNNFQNFLERKEIRQTAKHKEKYHPQHTYKYGEIMRATLFEHVSQHEELNIQARWKFKRLYSREQFADHVYL